MAEPLTDSAAISLCSATFASRTVSFKVTVRLKSRRRIWLLYYGYVGIQMYTYQSIARFACRWHGFYAHEWIAQRIIAC